MRTHFAAVSLESQICGACALILSLCCACFHTVKHVHITVVTSAFSKARFPPSTPTHLTGFFKFIHAGERFQNDPLSIFRNAGLIRTDGQTDVFSKLSGSV